MSGFESPNYTQIPNDLFDIYLRDMDYAELKVVLALLRETLGFHRESKRMSLTKLQDMTGLSRSSVIGGAKKAEQKQIIKKENDGGILLWSIIWNQEKTMDDDLESIQSIGICVICGSSGLVHRHHIVPKQYGGNGAKINYLNDICINCHKKIHNEIKERIKNGESPTPKLFYSVLSGKVDYKPEMAKKLYQNGRVKLPVNEQMVDLHYRNGRPTLPPSIKETLNKKEMIKENLIKESENKLIKSYNGILEQIFHGTSGENRIRRLAKTGEIKGVCCYEVVISGPKDADLLNSLVAKFSEPITSQFMGKKMSLKYICEEQ